MKKSILILFIIFIVFGILLVAILENKHRHQVFHKYPFFLSTKFVQSNIRSGPGEDFPVVWQYKQKYMPFKVVASYKNWYQIQDINNHVGWIFKPTTSNIESALTRGKTIVRNQPNETSRIIATLDRKIVVVVKKINNDYVKIYLHISNLGHASTNIIGWTKISNLWGDLNSSSFVDDKSN